MSYIYQHFATNISFIATETLCSRILIHHDISYLLPRIYLGNPTYSCVIYTRVLLLWGTWEPGLTEIFKMISEHLNFISYKVHLAGNIEKKHKDLLVLKLLFCLISGGGLIFQE